MPATPSPLPRQRHLRRKLPPRPVGDGRPASRPPPDADGKWPSTGEAEALCQAADACNAAFAHLTGVADDLDLGLAAALVDCAELCATTAAFIMRGSAQADTLRGACARLARDVEQSCQGYPRDAALAD